MLALLYLLSFLDREFLCNFLPNSKLGASGLTRHEAVTSETPRSRACRKTST
jgi:hypothetical protein